MSRAYVTGLLSLVLWSGVTGCATVARSMAEQGTQGVLEAIREEKRERTAAEQALEDAVARRNAEQMARGMMDAVSGPATPPQALGQAGSLGQGGSGPALSPVKGGWGFPGGAGSFSSSLATQMAQGLSAELGRQLGPDGTGPLARSLSATAGQMASSMVQQSREEVGTLFPECGGLEEGQARACRDARLSQWGASFSKGVAGGLVQALQPWLLLLTFMGGLLVGLLVFLSLSVAKSNRVASRRGVFSRQPRHA